jgi:hypothetical protein
VVTHTPLHSVLALSRPGRLEGLGAIDLYRVHPVGAMAVDVLEAWAVASASPTTSPWPPTEMPTLR